MSEEKESKKKKGAPRSRGKRSKRIENYYLLVYPPRKIRRILHNNGLKEAQKWAEQRSCTGIYIRIARELRMMP